MSFSGLRFGLSRMESRTARGRARTSQRRVIGLERLEVRLVLSTSTWTGMGANANWSTAANWDVPPVSGAGTDLIFPPSALQLANVDDLGPAQTFGTLTLSGGGYSITAANGSTASFTSIDSSQDSLSNTFDVPIALSAATIVTVDNAPASLVLGGVISGAEPLTSAGDGTLDLTADNTYTGATTVNSGTLLVDGTNTASAVSVQSGATLGGVGTVASVTATGGTISPGNPAPGILTDAGILSLAADTTSGTNSTFSVVLDGTTPGSGSGDYSQLKAAGAIGLSGVTLSGTLGPDFVPAVGSTYTILDNTGTAAISGTFSGQAQGSVVEFSGMPFSVSYVGGTSPNANSVVLTELDQSTTKVTFTPAAPVFGQSVALTATVTGPSGSPTPTGTVEFLNGTASLGTVEIANGTGTLDVTSLPVTTSTISAQYSGDSNFAPSTAPGVSILVAQASTKTTLTPSTTTPVFGESVTLTAAVSAVSPGAGTPTGTVQFFNGTTSLGTATLSAGLGSISTSALALGANSITEQYSGDTNFLGQTSTATTLTVGQASTTTTISSTPTSPVFGQAVTITAAVVVVSPGTGTPTGTVKFMIGSTVLGTATLSSGAADITTSSLPVGSDTISTVYSGATDFAGGNSTGTVTVGQSSTSTTLTVSNPIPQATESITLSAVVSAVSPGAGLPTGTVTFLNNGTSIIGTATLSGGKATFTASALPVAVNSITAQYNGDTNFSSSTSTAVTVSVGTANDQWLNQVFEILLNRPITSAEIPFWNKQFAKGRSRYSIASEISKGKEARIAAVQDAFELYLGQEGTPAELAAAVKTAHDTSTSVQAAVLGSHTFFEESGATQTLYFQSLLTAVFGTTFPDPHIEGLLSEGVPRLRVANALLQSDLGRQSLLTQAYNTVLQRDPTQPEIVLYLSQMKHENVLLRSIVVTLLASNEFYVKATTPGGLSS
jgi:autotransporter-associated beta strand protein